MYLANVVRELRKAWFNKVLYRRSHEREWEADEQAERRERDNEELKKLYDEQTEQLISGKDVKIVPYCWNDM